MKCHLITQAGSGEQFHCTEEQHLLQGMQAFRPGLALVAAIPVGCRGGGCGIGRVRVLSGDYECKKMSRKHIREADHAAGLVLACRVYPRGAMEIEVVLLPEDN